MAILRDVLGGWLYLLVGGLGVLGEARNGGLVLLLLVGRILVGTIHRRGAKERVRSGWLVVLGWQVPKRKETLSVYVVVALAQRATGERPLYNGRVFVAGTLVVQSPHPVPC
jgi:hypothetical protein